MTSRWCVAALISRLENRRLTLTSEVEVGSERGSNRQNFPRQFSTILLLVTVIGSFYFATIRDGHPWGDDFALYIQHAKNIVEHVSYDHTNYIFDPNNPTVGPRTYPPGYPLLLSLVYWRFGLNLVAMKTENVGLFVLFLLQLFFVFRSELPFSYVVTLIAVVGCNPYLWDFKDNVLSDLLFALLSYAALWMMHLTYHSSSDKIRWKLGVGAAVLVYFSYATRSIGLVFIPALLSYEFLRFKRVTRIGGAITIAFLAGWIIQERICHSGGDYLRLISTDPRLIVGNLIQGIKELSRLYFWPDQLSKVLRFGLFAALGSLAVFGYVARIRREATVYELFPLFYFAPLTVFPLGWEPRYVIPIVPLFLFYVFVGLLGLPRVSTLDTRKIAFIVLVVCSTSVYLSGYSRLNFRWAAEGVSAKEAMQLFSYIKTETEPTSVFVFRKPRALALFGERESSVYHLYRDENDLWKYFKEIDAEYLVEGPIDEPYWHSFIASQRDRLLRVYTNDEFTIYKIKN